MKTDDYRREDATGLAKLVDDGVVSAEEVHDAARRAIETVDADLNAVADGPWTTPLAFDRRGPFSGVPFVVKDLLCHTRDRPTRLGSRLTGDGLHMEHGTYLMQRFQEAGLATTALTTTPELGFNATTEALVHGATRNPWDPTRSPGGSSGGSSALVAARAVPAGHANDSGGSIRIPASTCGLVGLKPSRGRVPVGPDAQEVVFGEAVELAVTRTVRDTAALLDAVTGPMPGEKAPLPRPSRPFREEVGIAPGALRVAVHTDSWAGGAVHPDVRAAVEQVAGELEHLGHQVETATPDVDWDMLIASQTTIWCASLADAVTGIAAARGLDPDEGTLERVTLAAYRQGSRLTALELAQSLGMLNSLSRSVGRFFTQWDVLLTPTLNTPVWPLGHLDQDAADLTPEGWLRSIFDDHCTFTPLFNITGTPAITLPLGVDAEGLPVGVQLAAPMGAEAALLRLAGQLETALPWDDRLPAIRAGS